MDPKSTILFMHEPMFQAGVKAPNIKGMNERNELIPCDINCSRNVNVKSTFFNSS